MSEKPPKLWDRIKATLRFWLASAAMRYCGPELIYWIDPEAWEKQVACETCAARRRYEAESDMSEHAHDMPEHVHDIGDLLP